jgi:prepilin signal peptidase PulO-like enzyme (type II secretory pathway)
MEVTLFTIVGLLIGSLLNAAEYRVRRELPISWDNVKREFTRSMCIHCERTLLARDLIPVVSFFWLRRRCRHCKKTIAWQYPAVEIATGVLFGLSAWTYGPLLNAVLVAALCALLVFLFVYDLKYQLVPDIVSLPAIVLAGVTGMRLGVSWQSMAIGALIVGGFFAAQYALSKGKWVGGGDIRIGVLMGLLLGWEIGLFALLIAYIIGGIVAGVLLATKKMQRNARVAFGPFLIGSTFLSLFWGAQLLDAYLSLLG